MSSAEGRDRQAIKYPCSSREGRNQDGQFDLSEEAVTLNIGVVELFPSIVRNTHTRFSQSNI